MKITRNNVGKLFVISAPSGAGKTTLVTSVLEKLVPKYQIAKVVTYTTRMPRNNEVEGKDYFFISKPDFFDKIKAGFFLETTTYNGEFYGSPLSIQEDLTRGYSFILITDWRGAKNLLNLNLNPVLLWIVPPSLTILKQRLKIRGTESDSEINARINLAQKEMLDENKERLFEFHIINDDFQKAVHEICNLIQKSLIAHS